MQKSKYVVAFLLVTVALTDSALADDLYLGATIGSSSLDLPSTSPVDDRATGWKVFGGYEFGNSIAVEAGYADLGNFDGSETFGGVIDELDVDISGIDLFVVGSMPLGQVDAFAKIGVIDWEVELSGSTTDPSIPGPPVTFREKIDGTDLAAALGLDYDVGNNFSLRGEVEWFDIDDIDGVFVFSVGAVVTF